MNKAKEIRLFVVELDPGGANSLTNQLKKKRYKIVGCLPFSDVRGRRLDGTLKTFAGQVDIFLVLLDSRSDIKGSLSLLARFCSKVKVLPVLVVGDTADSQIFRTSIAYGAHGYLLQKEMGKSLDSALHIVRDGGYGISPGIAPSLETTQISGDMGEIKGMLTARELEVLQLIVEGMSSKEIAEKLGIERRTVDTHRQNMNVKINPTNLKKLSTLVALMRNLLSLGEEQRKLKE